ncbi:hypothetical protein [Mycolicibacterium llatzerense]|uniref:hypothetical protein n=1 Tax=Mycolicibacterium llatzerense TaxID=280871 RepID=UPI0021B602AA|nr:hypothetical protein [Mycolicibacterium llatzerense]MCT7373264.1 hypothetical protein [Mycolicibacterium llatzerense]
MQPSFYEPFELEPQPNPGGAVYSGHYTGVLKHVLDQARAGTLPADWRAHIPRPTGIFNASQRFQEAGTLAIQRLGDMEPQPWEPGQASDWRHALDAWFAAARYLLAVEHTGLIEMHLRTLRTGERSLVYQVPKFDVADGPPDPATLPWSNVAGEFQDNLDRTLRGGVDNYIVLRDWLTASYLGGLTAGGSPHVDWRQWLTGRAETWADASGMFGNRVRSEVNIPAGAHPIDKLPTYWLGPLADLETETKP